MWLLEFGHIDNIVFYVFCAVAAVVCILALANILAGCCVTGSSGASSLDFVTALGTGLLSFTVLVRGLDPDWGKASQFETLCEFYPAVLLMGLTLFMGGLFVKGWGIYLYNKFNGDKQPLSQEWKPNLWIWFLLIVAGIVSLIWCLEYTPEIEYMDKDGKSTESKSDADTYECKYSHEEVWMIATSAWHGVLLLLAVVAVIPNCKVSHVPEASIHSLITINTLLAVVAGICVHFLYDDDKDDETVEYAINGGLILWMCLFANIFNLGARMCTSKRSKDYEADD